MPHRLLIHGAMEGTRITDALKASFPDAHVVVSDAAPTESTASPFDVVLARAETNAALAHVRQLRRLNPRALIIVLADRDRSAAAYMAGANEFAMSYDADRVTHMVSEIG